MQFDHVSAPRPLMESVNILSNECQMLGRTQRSFNGGQRFVGGVRHCRTNRLSHWAKDLPHETGIMLRRVCVELVGRDFVPYAIRATKGTNPRGNGNTSASENNDPRVFCQVKRVHRKVGT